MWKLLAFLVLLTIGCGIASGVTIARVPAHRTSPCASAATRAVDRRTPVTTFLFLAISSAFLLGKVAGALTPRIVD